MRKPRVASLETVSPDRIKAPVFYALVLVALLGVNVLETVFLLSYSTDLRKAQDKLTCQAAVNDEFRTAFAIRSIAGANERAAQKVFLQTLRAPGLTLAQRDAAYDTYYAALAKADADRLVNPLPTDNC